MINRPLLIGQLRSRIKDGILVHMIMLIITKEAYE